MKNFFWVLPFVFPTHSPAFEIDVKWKLDEKLLFQVEDPLAEVDILVRLKAEANLSQAPQILSKSQRGRFVYEALRKVALSSQRNLVEYLEEKNLSYQRFYVSNLIAVSRVPGTLIRELALRSDVAHISLDSTFTVRLPDGQSQGIFDTLVPEGPGDNIQVIKAHQVWKANITGKNITVAGQDTGVSWSHPALKKKYRGYQNGVVNHKYNWHDSIHKDLNGILSNPCGVNSGEPCDDDDHGTHTMGTVVGDDDLGNQIGVAPGAQWIACRNMDEGTGKVSTYIECFEFFLAPYAIGKNPMLDGLPEKAPDVINNSWGCTREEGCSKDELLNVMKSVSAAGIMIVAAAGNEGPTCSSISDPPAWHSLVTFTVGAFDVNRNTIADFSSRGPSVFDKEVGPDAAAPGVSVRSAVRGDKYESAFWDGTSMASPHVVGLVALLWSAKPTLIGDILKTTELIRKSSVPKPSTQTCGGIVGTTIPNNTFGWGLIDAEAAVKKVILR